MTVSLQSILGQGTIWKIEFCSWDFNISSFAGKISRQPFLELTHGRVLNTEWTSKSSCRMKVGIFGSLLLYWQRGHYIPQQFWHNSWVHEPQSTILTLGIGKTSHFLQIDFFLKSIMSSKSIFLSNFSIVVTNLIGKDQNRIGQSFFDLISNPFLL